ncbi:hypothetical protein MHU86_17604 [Fragilaria crotonensis]|nr:hypothetical protein MHU86_17604 [Fragilaria crotonensis]
MAQPVAQIWNGRTSNMPENDLMIDVKKEDAGTSLKAGDGGSGEEATFTWDDDGVLNTHGLMEHRRLIMIENGTKTSFQIGDAVLLEAPKGCNEPYVARIDGMWQEAEHPERNGESLMMIRCHWYYRKDSVVRMLPSANFVGEISKKMLVNSMTKNDLLLTDHCDDNDVCSIVGKCTVIDRPTEGAHHNSVYISRFSASLTRDQIRVTTKDKGFLCEGKVMKRKAVHKSNIKQQKKLKSDSMSGVMAESVQAKGERKNASRHSSELWEMHGFSSLSQKKAVAKTISKQLPGDMRRCAFQVGSFFLFVNERQRIWERRNNGDPAPWSQCIVFNEYFFCNNYRELDRGTNYFRDQMLQLREKYPTVGRQVWLSKVLFASMCYRLLNLIETFEAFGGIPEPGAVSKFLTSIRETMKAGKIAFTGAHQTMGFDRYNDTMHDVVKSLNKLASDIFNADLRKSLRDCYHEVTSICNVGPFFAWQITCDLMECGCLPNCTENDYAKLGNGAVKGIQLIFGKECKSEVQQVHAAMLLGKLQNQVFADLGVHFPRFRGKELTLKDIEHALCEFNKYYAIQRSLRTRNNVMGQRLIKSRSSMNLEVCGCGETEEVTRCRKCLNAYCSICDLHNDNWANHWICWKCVDFDCMQFSD